MSNIIFCSNCGLQVNFNITKCSCGYDMTVSEKNEIKKKLQQVESNNITDNQIGKKTRDIFRQISDYDLDGTYFRASSAKKDFEKKAYFIQDQLIPKINIWKDIVEKGESNLAKDKIEVYGRVYSITEFVLKEFFGPFTVKDNKLQDFIGYRDFSKYELEETMSEANLDFSDIQTVNFGSVGTDMVSSAFSALENGSFVKLAEKSEWSKSDINTVKAEVGIAVAGELIAGISNIIGQNSEAIENVRIADNELADKIDQLSNVINSLDIEDRELKKSKRLFDKIDIILDTCYVKILKPISEELNSNSVYLEYKKERKPFDYEQAKIKMDEEIMKQKVKVSFWQCLLLNKNWNFKIYFGKRIKYLNIKEKYNELNSVLNEKHHKSLKYLMNYGESKTADFMEFEKLNRRVLKLQPAIANNFEKVKGFALVLKNVKSNLN